MHQKANIQALADSALSYIHLLHFGSSIIAIDFPLSLLQIFFLIEIYQLHHLYSLIYIRLLLFSYFSCFPFITTLLQYQLLGSVISMGQNECCAEKQFNNNAEYAPNLAFKSNKNVPRKVAVQVLAGIVKKKMQQLPKFQVKNKVLMPKGVLSDSYEQVGKPKGYYRGQWSNQKFHGTGQFFFKDGSYYQGTFRNGKAEGEGRYIFNNGCIYEGEIRNNEANGQGTYFDPFQNYQYVGEWQDDVPHGHGKEKFSNGSYYEGTFVNGIKEGYGHYVCQSGVYEGHFKRGNFNGQGTFNYTDNRTYKGEWVEGLLSGYGIFSWPDGNRYEGQYKNGLKEGRGTFFFANGKIFRGKWVKGLKHGAGELKINNQIIKGMWKNGELETALDDQDSPDVD